MLKGLAIDVQLCASISDTHTAHTYIHTKSLTPFCTARLTLLDYGNRLSPRKTADFPLKHGNTHPHNTHTHTELGCGVSGEAPNCAALLEKWTLFYPLFTCWVLDGWIKPQELPLCVWPCECWGWVSLCVYVHCVRVCVCLRVGASLSLLLLYASTV